MVTGQASFEVEINRGQKHNESPIFGMKAKGYKNGVGCSHSEPTKPQFSQTVETVPTYKMAKMCGDQWSLIMRSHVTNPMD
jgi:hypothetical protein